MTDSSHARAHIIVTGRVQGVNFRWFVQEAARRLGLVGSVQNLATDQVEVFVEGERPTVERLIEIIRVGNRPSRVDRLDVDWKTVAGEFSQFRILLGGW